MLRPSRCIGTAELHAGAIYFDIVRFTNCHRAIYICQLTECQNSFRSYVHQHACAEKTHVLLYLFAKDTAGTPEKIT